MSKKSLFIILSLLLIISISSVFLVGIFHFGWFKNNKENNYTIYIPKLTKTQSTTDMTKKYSSEKKDITDSIIDLSGDQKILKNKKESKDLKYTLNSKTQNQIFTKKENSDDSSFGKGSNLNSQEFHSLGELITEEEHKYRLSLVNNLKIKTVIIDSITKGNGVSQEYYKVVYKTNMIPAKILNDIINTKEFRKLIPNKYLSKEFELSGLKKGERITFKNSDIKNILIQWTLGRLTPIEKAWESKAL